MGLSQHKLKQRIGSDPRNLGWAKDASRFGKAYLAKLGWTAGSGLGVDGEGRTSHITVRQKLNMLGIGADTAGADPTIAWKQGRDFEGVLARLNAISDSDASEPIAEHALKSTAPILIETDSEKKRKPTDDDSARPRKRHKDKPTKLLDSVRAVRDSTDSGSGSERRKRKEEKRRRKGEKRARKVAAASSTSISTSAMPQSESSGIASLTTNSTANAAPKPAPVIQPVAHRSHRSRFLASKRMANGNAAAMSEILGIAPSSTSAPATPNEITSAPPLEPASYIEGVDDSLIKTSSKSVADYFKEKLAAKLGVANKPATSTPLDPHPDALAGSETPVAVESESARKERKRKHKEEKDSQRLSKALS